MGGKKRDFEEGTGDLEEGTGDMGLGNLHIVTGKQIGRAHV